MSKSKNDDVDVVIVGAGPSGAVAAKRLAEKGYSVVVLERGSWPDHSSTRSEFSDFELAPGRDWLARPDERQSPGDQPLDETDSDIAALIWNGVGGSAVAFAAQWQRNTPSDFKLRTLEGIADDWPITYEELIPYYQRIERDFAVSGLDGDPAFPGTKFPMPPVRLREWGKKIARAHDELGWHWWPGSNAIATRQYGPLGACNERGTCMQGCPVKAKSSPDLTHWPDAIRLGVELRINSHVTRVETNAAGLATGVVYRDVNGVEQFQGADVVILAANGIGTPWLLQSSTSARHPDGLGNSSGLVGKRLMMHPLSTVVGIFEDPMGTWQGAWGQQAYSMQFYETDESRGFVRGAKWALVPSGGPVSTTQTYPWGRFDQWGENFHQTVQERMGHSATWAIISEDLPEERNHVSLSTDIVDRFGMPVPKLNYRNSENSNRLLRWHEARATESLQAAGAQKIAIAPAIRNSGWHLLGTAKMGTDPSSSVVDGEGRSHDVPNLFIFDGSTWPTSSGTNPTATIAALALRNTERLIARGANREVTS